MCWKKKQETEEAGKKGAGGKQRNVGVEERLRRKNSIVQKEGPGTIRGKRKRKISEEILSSKTSLTIWQQMI